MLLSVGLDAQDYFALLIENVKGMRHSGPHGVVFHVLVAGSNIFQAFHPSFHLMPKRTPYCSAAAALTPVCAHFDTSRGPFRIAACG